MKKTSGLAVIEIVLIVIALGLLGLFIFVQKNSLEVTARDDKRKVAINAMYYSLEKVYYEQNGYYPQTIDETILPSVDPDLFTDPSGTQIGQSQSDYRYEPTDCSTSGHCMGYTLRTTLENEADFIKQNN